MSSRVQEVKLNDFLSSLLDKYGGSLSKRNIIDEAARLLGRFTYKQLIEFLRSQGIYIKQETIKREVRRLKEHDVIEECGEYKRQKIWCWKLNSETP